MRRRSVLKALTLLFGFLVSCRSQDQTGRRRARIPLGSIGSFKVGIVALPVLRLAVVRDSAGLGCVSTTCTHQICALRLNQSETGQSEPGQPEPDCFECPCHGSRFDCTGSVLNGPATKPLPWYQLEHESGELYVNLDVSVVPEWRLKL